MKARLAAGETLIGTFLTLGSPLAAEALGLAGFDWLLVDLEHGGGDESLLLGQVLGATAAGVHSLVRVESDVRGRTSRALDIGVEGVMCPQVNSAAQAEAWAQPAVQLVEAGQYVLPVPAQHGFAVGRFGVGGSCSGLMPILAVSVPARPGRTPRPVAGPAACRTGAVDATPAQPEPRPAEAGTQDCAVTAPRRCRGCAGAGGRRGQGGEDALAVDHDRDRAAGDDVLGVQVRAGHQAHHREPVAEVAIEVDQFLGVRAVLVGDVLGPAVTVPGQHARNPDPVGAGTSGRIPASSRAGRRPGTGRGCRRRSRPRSAGWDRVPAAVAVAGADPILSSSPGSAPKSSASAPGPRRNVRPS